MYTYIYTYTGSKRILSNQGTPSTDSEVVKRGHFPLFLLPGMKERRTRGGEEGREATATIPRKLMAAESDIITGICHQHKI